jgi:hypothetical protein
VPAGLRNDRASPLVRAARAADGARAPAVEQDLRNARADYPTPFAQHRPGTASRSIRLRFHRLRGGFDTLARALLKQPVMNYGVTMSMPPIRAATAYHGARMPQGGRQPTLVVVAFVALAATASCRQVLGITDPPRPCGDELMIDDFEDGDHFICNSGRRRGAWFSFGDGSPDGQLGSGTLFSPSPIPAGETNTSRRAAHFTGSGFTRWGAILGLNFNFDGISRAPYNANSAGIIKFRMKSNTPIGFDIITPDTALVIDGGTCVEGADGNCNRHFRWDISVPAPGWTEYKVPFSALRQDGNAQWDPSKLFGLQFVAPANVSFDVWIDDVAFEYCALPECKPTCTDPKAPVACAKAERRRAGCFPADTTCAVDPSWCLDPTVIDDMEDGDGFICESAGRDGGWYTFAANDGVVQFEQGLIPGGRGDSWRAAHLTASGLTGWGAGMGVGLNGSGQQLYDPGAANGLAFWARGNVPVVVQFRLAETTPAGAPPGTCTNPADCDNHFKFGFPAPGDQWTEYRVPFTALRQGAGGSVRFDPSHAVAVEFAFPAPDIDIWIDDLRFYTCQGAACVPTCADPMYPVACPASGSLPAYCWPAGTDCANPPDLTYHTSIGGTGSDDVWIVGLSIDDAATVSHWDGNLLSPVTIPALGLWAVWSSGPDDIWTFGIRGTIARRRAGVWSSVASGTTMDLFQGAWGSGANDVWAAGAAGTIVHWNGTSWSVSSSHTTEDLWGLWGSGANDVWTVGAGGTIRRWNGAEWQAVPSGTTRHLDGVWGSGPNDVWAVGEVVLHWNGTAWSNVASGTDQFLESAWGSGPDDVWAVGENGTVLHWDGSGTWEPRSIGTQAYLNGVWGTGRDDVWIVGARNTVLHFDGVSWTPR